MIHTTLKKHVRPKQSEQKFSLLIPSWNNLEYLKLCIGSIRKHAHFNHQIIVLINEGKDGSREWVQQQEDLDYVIADQNIGICYGLNVCRSLVSTKYVVYINDDMYLLPGWDLELWKEIEQLEGQPFMLSATMIEPYETGNPCVIVQDYGDRLENFREEALLNAFQSFEKSDWSGSTWPPLVVPLELWDWVGGMSTEFSPGMYSDPDFSMKLWQAGLRYFKGVSRSRVYHFGSKSTGRVRKNAGRAQFIRKYGMTANSFLKYYLKRGAPFTGPLPEPKIPAMAKVANKIKVLKQSF